MSKFSNNGGTTVFEFKPTGEIESCSVSRDYSKCSSLDNSRGRRCCKYFAICIALTVFITTALAVTGVILILQASGDVTSGGVQQGQRDEFFEQWVPPLEVTENAGLHLGRDKENRHVWFFDVGQWDFDLLLKTNETRADLQTYMDQICYRHAKILKTARDQHGNTTGWGMVVNLDGFGLSKALDFSVTGFLQDTMKRYLGEMQDFDYAIVINMPTWAMVLKALFKQIWGETLDRMEMFGYDDWLPILLERIPLEELPPGGYRDYVT